MMHFASAQVRWSGHLPPLMRETQDPISENSNEGGVPKGAQMAPSGQSAGDAAVPTMMQRSV